MYQNRNAIVSNVMGGESVHAAIERKLRNIPIHICQVTFWRHHNQKSMKLNNCPQILLRTMQKNLLLYMTTFVQGTNTSKDLCILFRWENTSKDLPLRKRRQSVSSLQDYDHLRGEPIKKAKRKWLDLQRLNKSYSVRLLFIL